MVSLLVVHFCCGAAAWWRAGFWFLVELVADPRACVKALRRGLLGAIARTLLVARGVPVTWDSFVCLDFWSVLGADRRGAVVSCGGHFVRFELDMY